MVGSRHDGHDRQSMACVGNVSTFVVQALRLGARAHLFNYADKPDFSMQEFVDTVICRPSIDHRSPGLGFCTR